MKKILSVFLALSLIGCAAAVGDEPQPTVSIIGGPCEGCDAVFLGMPDADRISSHERISPKNQPGEPMQIEGRVLHADGSPAPGTIVYAYQTDIEGIYPRDENYRGQSAYRHGKLRGWVKADADGRYRFDTIRPAGYPSSRAPQHIHMHVIEPGCCTYYIDDILFRDDPRLSPRTRDDDPNARGGNGVVTPKRDDNGVWQVRRDIILGQGIRDYPARSETAARP